LKAEGKQIRAVTFDLWETLLFERDGANSLRTAVRCRNIAAVLNGFGVQSSSERVDLAIKTAISTLITAWDKSKDISHADQLRLIIQAMPRAAARFKDYWPAQLSTAFVSPIFEVRPYLNPDAQKVLHELKKRGKLTAVICNTGLTPGSALRKLLAEFQIAEYFDLMIFSEELGIRKPDREIFNMATRGLKVKQCEAVHVGDNLKSDVWGAKNAGLKAIHLSSEVGRDKTAEADPNSLLSLSRELGGPVIGNITPDSTINSLAMLAGTIKELETQND
jgi:FMN phosphatase YigB (HAD superfamily)